jgi:transposase-like protein
MNSIVTNPNWQTALATTGLSLRALARQTGISHTYLRAIVAGHQLPSEPIRLRLLACFKNYRSEDLFGALIPAAQTSLAITTCKRCSSPRTIKSGLFQGIQRYQCKDCGCVFIDNLSPLHGRLPAAVAVSVMELFFAGEPLSSIRTLVQESQGIQVSITGLEKMIYRLARKAVKLTEDILPEIHSQWVLDGAEIPGAQPVTVLDILDLDSGFIISSDVVRQDYAEKDRESVLQKALHITGITPDVIILGPTAAAEYLEDPEDSASVQRIEYNSSQEANICRYSDSMTSKIRLLSQRVNFDSITNHRLLSAAWRVNYNLLSDIKLAAGSPYQSWADIINSSEYSEAL